MKLPRCLLPLLALAALAFTACSTTVRLSGLAINIIAFHPADAAHPENGGTLDLQVVNETVASLGISRSAYKLFLNGTLVGTAESAKPLGIPAMTFAPQEATVHFDKPDLVRQIATGPSPVAHYRLESVFYQTINEDHFETRAVSEGDVDLRGPAAPAK